MICDVCHEREAVIFYAEVINGIKKEKHLCESCAAKQTGLKAPFISLSDNAFLTNLLASVLGHRTDGTEAAADTKDAEGEESMEKTNLRCPDCGMTYNEFIRFGNFGCGSCYRTFHFLLDSYLKRIQGNCEHTGKRPLYTGETVNVPVFKAMPKAQETESKDRNIAIMVDEDSTEAELRAAIKRAVAREEYEEAARLRDILKAGKTGQDGQSVARQDRKNAREVHTDLEIAGCMGDKQGYAARKPEGCMGNSQETAGQEIAGSMDEGAETADRKRECCMGDPQETTDQERECCMGDPQETTDQEREGCMDATQEIADQEKKGRIGDLHEPVEREDADSNQKGGSPHE